MMNVTMTGRPRQFERDRALTKAMEIFWSKGYEATSVQDLLDAMGINRGSMYSCFGDKHELFLEALRHYRESKMSGLMAFLDRPGSSLGAIEGVLRNVAAEASAPECRGCLLTNATVESAPHDIEIAKAVTESTAVVEKAFRRALERAAEAGELKAGVDVRATARFLNATLHGLIVLGKARAGRGALDDVVDVAISTLR